MPFKRFKGAYNLDCIQGLCWNVEEGQVCIYKSVSGGPLPVASAGSGEVAPGTKAIVTRLPPVSFETAPRCTGSFNKDNEDNSGRFWGFEASATMIAVHPNCLLDLKLASPHRRALLVGCN